MRIIVVGLGYVGLPLAVQLAKHFETWGLDINQGRIDELNAGFDRTDEIDAARLKAFAPAIDIELMRRYLNIIPPICAGDESAGPDGISTRWHTAHAIGPVLVASS